MGHKSFIYIIFISFFISCISLWRASVGPSGERMMEVILQEMQKKPEVVASITIEGVKRLQSAQEKKDHLIQLEKVKKKRNEMLGDNDSPWSGNPKGDVVVFSFFDYHCGYCRRVNATLEKLIASDKNIKVVYKEYPIFGDYTFSKAALAAHKQGRYKDFYEVLMSSDGNFSLENLLDIAKRLKLNMPKFTKDMNSPEVESLIKKNMSLGQSLDISMTPTFIFGDSVVPGSLSLEQFREAITKERAKASAQKSVIAQS